MSLYVTCYDVSDDTRRDRLRKLLKAYGDPVEESVFEVRLSGPRLRKLEERMRAIVGPREDVVLIYELCRRCEGRRRALAGPPVARVSDLYVV